MSLYDFISDAVKGLPVAEVLRERIALAEEKYSALEREVAKLKIEKDYAESQNKELRLELQQRAAEIHALQVAMKEAQSDADDKQCGDLPELQHKVLLLLKDCTRPMNTIYIAQRLGITEPLARHTADQLGQWGRANYVSVHLTMGKPPDYAIATKGRAYLAERNLL